MLVGAVSGVGGTAGFSALAALASPGPLWSSLQRARPRPFLSPVLNDCTYVVTTNRSDDKCHVEGHCFVNDAVLIDTSLSLLVT